MADAPSGLTDTVGDEEVLHRRVLDACPEHFPTRPDGTVRISSQAFNDAARKPSVDRAKIVDAAFTQEGSENGVLQLVAENVRKIRTPKHDKRGRLIPNEHAHSVDVLPVPIKDSPNERDNPGHAELRPSPEIAEKNKNAFHKVQEALVQCSTWVILPASARKT